MLGVANFQNFSGKDLPNHDINELVTGIYSTVADIDANLPANYNGILVCFKRSAVYFQVYITMGENAIYQRYYWQEWSSWRRLQGTVVE